ncbi:hypothetical protein KB221_04525 [Aquidulcibacter paucihalophilus]|jgi:hypothetical protein|nr:hypothetical protein KB221_04525 [Aquidulcibacter paucihalophilus]
MRLSILATAVFLSVAAPAAAGTPPSPPAVPAAAPADVATPEAIVAALYNVISGDQGVARDWDRFRALFHPTARLMPSGLNAQGVGVVRSVTPDEYIALAEPVLVGQGFHEREITRRSERFGRIVHVWTTYESLHTLSDPQPFARGINSIQLFHDGSRWWILSVYWQGESPSEPIPADYLPAAG